MNSTSSFIFAVLQNLIQLAVGIISLCLVVRARSIVSKGGSRRHYRWMVPGAIIASTNILTPIASFLLVAAYPLQAWYRYLSGWLTFINAVWVFPAIIISIIGTWFLLEVVFGYPADQQQPPQPDESAWPPSPYGP